MQRAIQEHCGIHLCELYSHEIHTKFACTTDSHVCWLVTVNTISMLISRKCRAKFCQITDELNLLSALSESGTMILTGCVEPNSCAVDMPHFVNFTLIALCFV